MKTSIEKFYQSSMQHGEFVSFHGDSLVQMEESEVKTKFIPQLEQYRKAVERLRKVYAVYAASELTAESDRRDALRDKAYSGFKSYVKICTSEDEEDVAAAAGRILFVIEKNEIDSGNPLRIGATKETAALDNLEANLAPLAADIEKIGAKNRFTKLTEANHAYDVFQQERYSEKGVKSSGDTKAERAPTEEAYYAVVDRVNAQILLTGDESLLPFVNAHNATVKKYKDLTAQRKGQK